jgi:TPP-dependent pyruvate/acetoin dehydrogenase alpha subunit
VEQGGRALSTTVRNRRVKQDGAIRYRDRLTKNDLLEIYRRLWFARVFDETLYDMKKKGRLRRGNVYGSRGQEAIQVGTTYPLRPDDFTSPIHRDMPIFVFRGMTVEQVMCQVWGKANAPTRGKDSWSHMGDMRLGIIHSTSMLGSTIPVACGVLWAQRLDGNRDRVCVAYLGEGATATGPFHEGLNYAAVHKLPLIVVVENNQYAYSTPVELEVPTPTVADRAKGYGIPGYSIDGNDVLEVYDTMCEALEHARAGKGPVLIECVTYRLQGHADHDETRARQYRPVEEIEMWEKRDPIVRYREYLLTTGLFTEAELPEPPADIVEQIQNAVEYAIQSPDPEPHTALEDIYDESAGVSR